MFEYRIPLSRQLPFGNERKVQPSGYGGVRADESLQSERYFSLLGCLALSQLSIIRISGLQSKLFTVG